MQALSQRVVLCLFLFYTCVGVYGQSSITGQSQVCLNTSTTYTLQGLTGTEKTVIRFSTWEWVVEPANAGRVVIQSSATTNGQNPYVTVEWNNSEIKEATVRFRSSSFRVNFSYKVFIGQAGKPVSVRILNSRLPSVLCLSGGQTSHSLQAVQTGESNSLSYEWEITSANGSIVAGQGTPQIQVAWNNPQAGQSSTIRVRARNTQCPALVSDWLSVTYPFAIELAVSPTAAIVSQDGSGVFCSRSTHRFTLQGVDGAVAYQWSFPSDAKAVYQPDTRQVDVTFGAKGGTIAVTAVNGCGENRRFSLPVQVAFPFSLAKIEGPLLVCAGRAYSYQVPQVLGASYQWQVPQGASIASGQGTARVQVAFSETAFSNGQPPRISVTASSPCNPQPIIVQSEPIAQRTPVAVSNQLFSFAELAGSSPSKSLLLNTCEQLDVALCQQRQIAKATLKVVFSTGNLHQLPIDTKFSQNLQFTLRAYDIQGQLIAGFPANAVNFSVSEQTPEAVYTLDFTAWHSQISRLEVVPVLTGTPVSNATVQQALQLTAFYEEQFSYNGQISPVVLGTVTDPVGNGSYERRFSWQAAACPAVGSYQLQVLRLYEAGTDSKNGGETLQGADWSKALSIETESAAASYQLTVAEGSGRYGWRVRALGNLEGGIANPKNWGPWSQPAEFTFQQPDENSQTPQGSNWIYSRTFTEGGRVSEKMSFANGLGQIAQVQAKIQSQEQVIISETRQDYSGRDALQTLPVPVTDKATLGYVPDFMKVTGANRAYQKDDFDADDTYKNPATATAGSYYSGQDVVNAQGEVVNAYVPSDGGYPYSRTRYSADGTSRVVEQGGVGADHRIGTKHTVKTVYTGVSDAELVQLFGKEAPAASNVHKVINSDPNGTSSVSYQTKDGKTIATALINTQGKDAPAGSLDPLESAKDATKTILEVITAKTPFAGIGTRSSKPLFFAVPTDLKVEYTLTPQAIADLCAQNTCKTCDYQIELRITNSETQDVVDSKSVVLEMSSCATLSQQPIALDPKKLEKLEGSFVVEKRITAYNRKTLTDGSSVSYLDEQLAAIEKYYSLEELIKKEAVWQQIGTFLNLNPSQPQADGGNLEGLYLFLNSDPEKYPLTEDAGQEEETEKKYSYKVPLNVFKESNEVCQQIILRIPYIATICPTYHCNFANPKTGKDVANPAPTPEVYYQKAMQQRVGPSGRVKPLTEVLNDEIGIGWKTGDLNAMFAAMATDGYDCEKLWTCWQQTVDGYDPAREKPTVSSSSSLNSYLSNPGLLDAFLRCMDVSPSILFQWDGSLLNENQIKQYYKLILLPTAATQQTKVQNCLTQAGIVANSFPYTLTASEQEAGKGELLSNCLRYQKPITEDDKNILKGLVVEKLQSACQGRYEDFRAQVIQTIHRNGQYIQPDPTRVLTKDQPNSEGDYYYLQKDEQGQLVSDPMTGLPVFSDTPLPANFSYQYQLCQIDQMAKAMVKNCSSMATEATLQQASQDETNLTDAEKAPILAAREKIRQILLYTYQIELNGANCGPEYQTLVPEALYIPVDPTPDPTVTVLRDVLQVDGYPSRQGFTAPVATEPSQDKRVFSDAFSAAFWMLKKGDLVAEIINEYSYSPADGWGIDLYNNRIYFWNSYSYINSGVVVDDYQWTHIVVTYGQDGLKVYKNGVLASDPTAFPYQGPIKDNASYPLQCGSGVLNLGSINGYYDEMALFKRVLTAQDVAVLYAAKGRSDQTLLGLNPIAHWNFNQPSGKMVVDQSGQGNHVTLFGYTDAQVGLPPQVGLPQSSAENHWKSILSQPVNSNDLFAYWNFDDAQNIGRDASCRRNDLLQVQNAATSSDAKVNQSLRAASEGATHLIAPTLNNTPRAFTVSFWVKPTTLEPSQNIYMGSLWGEFVFRTTGFGGAEVGTDEAHKLVLPHRTLSQGTWQHITFTFANQVGKVYKNGELIATQSGMAYPQAWQRFEVYLPAQGSGSSEGVLDEFHIYTKVLSSAEITYLVESTQPITIRTCPKVACPLTSAFCFKWDRDVTDTDLSPPPALEDYVQKLPPRTLPCQKARIEQVLAALRSQLAPYQTERLELYREQYQQVCGLQDGLQESLTLSYSLGYHHYTLYYYDRAGNLVRTVPPQGVKLLSVQNADQLALARTQLPAHGLVTRYTYNSLGQLVRQNTPDGGTTDFYYNNKSQLRFSVNDKQRAETHADGTGYFSYTRYDELGRVTEVGESALQPETKLSVQVEQMSFPQADLRQVTKTVYSEPMNGVFYGLTGTALSGQAQRYLQNRVSYSYLDEDGNESTTQDVHYSYYSYDVHGNVEWLCQQLAGLDRKYIRYEYDLISGKVLAVYYQENQPDQFSHRYAYDEDNRLTQVETSRDGVIWEKDATYQYYRHGPLKRMELGEDRIQGVDYTYTLQGWLKAVNHPDLTAGHDPGKDGQGIVPADAFGMALTYYNGDYRRTSGIGLNQTGIQEAASPLYNGNIAAWTTQTAKAGVAGTNRYEQLTAEQYRYDDLNRIKASSFAFHNGTAWQQTEEYGTSYSYDANGNLLTLNRNAYLDKNKSEMDKLDYHYYAGTNRLAYVNDKVKNSDIADDIEDQTNTDNYTYDGIGNLTSDKQEKTQIEWTVYGKVKKVTKTDGSQTIEYQYDAIGNRTVKKVTRGSEVKVTYYIRDTQGNVMSIYERVQSGTQTPVLAQNEVYVYGSSRLGVYRPGSPVQAETNVALRQLQFKEYELSDHLGNVRAIVGDYRQADGANPIRAALRSYYNYYAFGMNMPGRNLNPQGSRYGFNGKELDTDLQSSYDFGARIYDARIGRWLSIDPLFMEFSGWSPYAFVFNNPINLIDPDGMKGDDPRKKFYLEVGKSAMKAITSRGIENKFKALYVLAQRRQENGFRLSPPGNNPMNLKGTGDAGVVALTTTEYIKGKKIIITTNFANFSTVEKGFEGYLNLIENKYPDAYEALSNNDMTIDDFTAGLQKIGYATDPNYQASIKKVFNSVVQDYKNSLTKELESNKAEIQNLENLQKGLIINDEYKQTIPGKIEEFKKKNTEIESDLQLLNELK